MLAVKPFSTIPIADIPEEYSQWVPSNFELLLADKYAERVYLLEITGLYYIGYADIITDTDDVITFRIWRQSSLSWSAPVDLSIQGDPIAIPDEELSKIPLPDLYLSDKGYTSSENIYQARVADPFSFDSKMYDSNYLIGQSRISYGNISIINNDGELDYLLGAIWDEAVITVKMGRPTFNYEDFETIFSGKAEQAIWDLSTINIRLRNYEAELVTPLQNNLYLGTGGLEGTEDLKGQPKPLCFGKCTNIEPVLVDPVNLIYHIHDGTINSVITVYFNGYPATLGVDYSVNLSNSTITLLGSPGNNVIVTADVTGDNTGGYVSSVTNIIQRILENYGGFSYPEDFDTLAFQDTEISNGNTVGIFIKEDTNINDVIDNLIESIGGFWGFNRQNKIFCGIVAEPNSSTILDLTKSDIISINRIPSPLHIWYVSTHYQKIWKQFTVDQLAGAVTPSEVLRLTSPYKQYIASDTLYNTPLSNKREIDSLFDTLSVAQVEGDRQFQLFNKKRDIYEITIKTLNFNINLGQSISVTLDRFGFDQSSYFIIIGYKESIRDNTLVLTVWG